MSPTNSGRAGRKVVELITNAHHIQTYMGDDLMVIVKPYRGEWIVINTDKAKKHGFDHAHTHIKTKRMAYRIKKNVEQNRMPKTRNEYLLISHIRTSMNKVYCEKIQQLIDVRRDKSPKHYINVNKGAR